MLIKKDELSTGDRILFNKTNGQMRFQRNGKPFVISSISSSIICLGSDCLTTGILNLIEILLQPSKLKFEIKAHTAETLDLLLRL